MFFLSRKIDRTKMSLLQAANPRPEQQEKEKKKHRRRYNLGGFSL
jgi:hypothetical protein